MSKNKGSRRVLAWALTMVMVLGLMPITAAAETLQEEFDLAVGGTYYFDLSGEGVPSTRYGNLPDTSLKWVPFIYVGTVNAYSLDENANGDRGASAAATRYKHSLFVADYNVAHTTPWNTYNDQGLIFGKAYESGGVDYTLRSLSMGNNSYGYSKATPLTNEWDQILDKGPYIKNYNKIFSWGQDTYSSNYRAVRGYTSSRNWDYFNKHNKYTSNYGWRPALEILNPGSLSSNALKTITYDMGSNGTLGSGSLTSATVVYTGALELPEITAENGFKYTGASDMGKLGWYDESNNFYQAGTKLNDLTTGATLTAGYGNVKEQFDLISGETYYFDLSGAGVPGTINAALPDANLNWVPFTYVGTLNAYSLDESAVGDEEASNNAPTSDHSLFVADYNITHTVSWDGLNNEDFIFGKTYESGGVDYTLRSLSMGSSSNGQADSNERGTPLINEWDQILNKGDYIKGYSNIYTWGQDTSSSDSANYTVRGYSNARMWQSKSSSDDNQYTGLRPALEILNSAALGTDALKTVTYDMGGNGTLGSGSLTSATVVYTGTLTLPEITPENGFNVTGTGAGTWGWYDGTNFYAPGAALNTLDGATLTFGFNSSSYIATVSPNKKAFTTETEGYGEQTAQEFTIENTGADNITGLTASLNDGAASAFEISTALSDENIATGGAATVSVRPKTGLAVGNYTDILTITGDNGIFLTASLSFTVQVTLVSITAPTDITGVANETEKNASALGLPAKVTLVTNNGDMQADVDWNVAASAYSPFDTAAQTFTVAGTVTLPDGVDNPNSVPLTTSISVSALAWLAPEEQFDLTLGETYYFNLSKENVPGQLYNIPLPDKSLQWVPFTYAGTVNAYSLTEFSDGGGTPSDRSLFVANYVVTHTMNWYTYNNDGLIFGKAYRSGGVDYTLRSLSQGSSSNGESGNNKRGIPKNNEWDQLLNKGNYIKNYSVIRSFGQDTKSGESHFRASRGGSNVRDWVKCDYAGYYGTGNARGFRPALEILNPAALGFDALKTVTYDMGGNGKLGSGSLTSATVVYTGALTLPEITKANGFNVTATGTGTLGWYDGTNFYAPGAALDTLTDGATLTAGFNSSSYIATVTPNNKTFTAATESYGEQTAQVFTIENTGIGDISGLTASLNDGSAFEISAALSGDGVAAGNTVILSVRPKTGLAVGDYTDTLTITGDNDIFLTASLSFTVNASPAYTATIDPDDKTFTAAMKGYGEQPAQVFTIENTGTGDISGLTASLNDGSAFEISTALSGDSVISGNTVTLSVRPKMGLSTGAYTDTLTITGNNGISLTVNLSFTVTVNLVSITVPTDITGVANGTAKSASALGLPAKVTLMTNNGDVQADVDWDVAASTYLPFKTAAQTFTVAATVTLPDGVNNPNGISLDLNIDVTVDAWVAPEEQFTLTPGGICYFDLSGAGVPGTKNTALPDASLKWVPFTYAGTVNAYSLDESSSGDTSASANAAPADRSLFVAGFNITNEVSWDELNNGDLIFGKIYKSDGVDYTLRSLSVGSRSNGESGSDERGIPLTNEWDQILNKGPYIKNVDDNFSWGQDTYFEGSQYRALRAYDTVGRLWANSEAAASGNWVSWRPALEILNPAALGADALKTVTYDMGNKGTLGSGSLTSATVVYTGTLTLPAITQANGFNVTGTGTGTLGWYDGTIFYAPGTTLNTLPDGTTLTFGFNSSTYTATVTPTNKTFTAATESYGEQTAQVFTIENTGTGDISGLTASLNSGSEFEISTALSDENIATGGIATLSVRPKTGLAVGTHTDILSITGNNGVSLTLSLSFTVNAGDGGSNNSGGGHNSGGDSHSDDDSDITVTPPSKDKPNSPTQSEIKVEGKVSGGSAAATITEKSVRDAYEKGMAEAKKNGIEQNGITLVMKVNIGNKAVNSVAFNLPKTAQAYILANKISHITLAPDSSDIRITLDLAAVKEINKQACTDVNITATSRDSSKLTGNAKAAIGSRPVFDLEVGYGGKTVQNFGAGSISVAIPYSLGVNEQAGNVQAVYVDAKGKVQWLLNSVYDSVNEVLRFSTSHFSVYGVGYKNDAPTFNDVGNHWAKNDISFLLNRGLFSGTSKTAFSPNTAMTRGMFVTALGRLAEVDVSDYAKSSFTDVKSDVYYMGYIEWASKNSIVNGVGNKYFAPNQFVTREQMAVVMSNYAKTVGYTLPKVYVENTFADNAKISAYAKEAVKEMQMAGIISGKNDNLFDPQGTATRAEMSAVLHRFVELVISSDTMQGWTMNDSGKWMYYENGKPITGKKDIDGSTYTFDQYGVTADIPKNLRYTTYIVEKGDSFWSIAHRQGCTMSELERLNNKSRFSLIHPGDVLRVPEK
ncbi:S-layer homology domain-containing protein [Anaerovorax odorimutans]|uniref:S-layer homology domain-containing protein n=1 Tax=Anaerovorax odorimutans TaxID=109327 RepID=UPI000421A5FE|nr:S-layer homology domain-containing protein [Anaerovorax odorimutans]